MYYTTSLLTYFYFYFTSKADNTCLLLLITDFEFSIFLFSPNLHFQLAREMSDEFSEHYREVLDLERQAHGI